jgi:preprotein translocase subunit SecY
LIVVGVALDTMSQVESHLIMRRYEGFLKKGRIQGRWFNITEQQGVSGETGGNRA